jgi:hypothetical protein
MVIRIGIGSGWLRAWRRGLSLLLLLLRVVRIVLRSLSHGLIAELKAVTIELVILRRRLLVWILEMGLGRILRGVG